MIKNSDRIEFELYWLFEHIFGKKALEFLFSKSKSNLKNRIFESVSNNISKTVEVERRKNLSISEFKKHYLKNGIPVIFDGYAKDWECVRNWSPQFIADKYGNDKISLIDASPDNVNQINYEIEETTLRDVILSMNSKELKKYSRFNRILYEHPELKHDFDINWLLKMRNFFSTGQTFQVFIGGKNTKTHLHSASEHNLFTQVYGKKHWVIYPSLYNCVLEPVVTRSPYFHSPFDPDNPDYEHFPSLKHLDRYECILEPGDILFNPPSFWHHVNNLSDSIGVGFRWFAPYNAFKIDFMQALLMMLAVNPPIWVATKHREDFPKIFSYMSKKSKRN